jgi:hypothetical protein
LYYQQNLTNKVVTLLQQQQYEIEKLKEENAELQRLFDKAMDEWAKDRQ